MEKKEIKPIESYDVYYVDLGPVMKKRGISKNSLCKMTGMAYNALQRYHKSEIKRVDLEIISRLCAALECDISDIVVLGRDED